MITDKQFEEAYREYVSLPLATLCGEPHSELYENGWVNITGLGFIPPDPHEHFTLIRYLFW